MLTPAPSDYFFFCVLLQIVALHKRHEQVLLLRSSYQRHADDSLGLGHAWLRTSSGCDFEKLRTAKTNLQPAAADAVVTATRLQRRSGQFAAPVMNCCGSTSQWGGSLVHGGVVVVVLVCRLTGCWKGRAGRAEGTRHPLAAQTGSRCAPSLSTEQNRPYTVKKLKQRQPYVGFSRMHSPFREVTLPVSPVA